jgi:hypothetical protein
MYAVDRYIKDYSLIDLKSYIHEQERDSLLSSSSSSFSRLSVSKIGIISYIGLEAVPDVTHTHKLLHFNLEFGDVLISRKSNRSLVALRYNFSRGM